MSRLRSRRLTFRKIALYTCAIVLLVLAEPDPYSFMLGTIFVLAGVAIRIWTFGHLEKNQSLTTSGPYAHSRNPAYVGSACILTGTVIAAGNNDSIAGIAVWCAGLVGLAIFFFIYMPRKYDREYGRLAELFPEEYEAHAANVPHFWPRLSPWRECGARRFSWKRVQLNHEIVWPVTCVFALSLMWL